MIAPNMDWETVMTSYDARNNVEMAFDIFKSEPNGRRGRTGDPYVHADACSSSSWR